MESHGVRPVLVGYDGSSPATTALRWAQEEAAHRQAPLELVYVNEWSTPAGIIPLAAGWPDTSVRREAVAALNRTIEQIRDTSPELAVNGRVLDGPIISELRHLSEQSQLLVVGHRGLGGFAGLLTGSVALGMAAQARCPVVVVRGSSHSRKPVVVGIDPHPHLEDVIRFAAEQAVARGVDLVAVRAWQPPPVPWRFDYRQPWYDEEKLAETEQALAEQLLEPWREKYSELTIRLRMVPRTAADALISASADAQLVVLGRRGRGGFAGLRLGSVARQLLHHSHCPIAIVPATSG